jgi:hypothetical protein
MNSEIIAYRDTKMKILQEDPLELNHYITSDNARADDYAGREILELLQNAIDVGSRVSIDLSDNVLTISNSGQPFQTENIKALMIPDNSTKTDSLNTIGCKGVGFRASLNISDDITIHSGDIHLNFSKLSARKMQERYNLPQIPPLMRCPEETPDVLTNEYTTNIIIKLRDKEQIKRVTKQIKGFNKDSIIFFNDNFESLIISINGTQNTYTRSRKILNDHEAIITLGYNNNLTHMREFFEEGILNNYEHTYDNQYKLSIVYSSDKIKHNRLYSFFHTEIYFPFDHWFAHGTFNLTNNRNQLIKNSRNKILMERLIQLICNSATQISQKVDYTAYRILRSHGRFSDFILDDINLNTILTTYLRQAPVLPTVDNTYVSIDSEPVFYDLNFQKYIRNLTNNHELLQSTDNKEIIKYLNQDVNRIYDLEVVAKHLQNYKFKNYNDIISCANSLLIHYKDVDNFPDLAPNFFLDEHGNKIDNNSILIKSDDLVNLKLPDFADLQYINNKLLQEAKRYFNIEDDASFINSNFAQSYGIKIANIDEILDKIDEIIKGNQSYITKYVRWLFDNRHAITPSSYNKFFVLAKDNKIYRSNGIYFGKEYIEDTVLEQIYDKSKILAKPSVFSIKPDEIDDFTSFLKEQLHVADSPRRKDGNIDGLERILKNSNTKYVINLLLSNRNFLNTHRNQSDARNIFRTSQWIQKNGKRYSPDKVILTSKRNYYKINNYLQDDFIFLSQEELLSNISMEKSAKIWLIEEYIDFNTELRNLDNQYIYQILNELPSFDPNGEISEDVYKDIIINNNDRKKPDTTSLEFDKFIKFGKVFCHDQSYHSLSDCFYLDRKYPQVIESEYNFINITKGKSPHSIWDRLHINTLSVDYYLHYYSKSKSNTSDFKNDLNNFKISIFIENSDYFFNEDNLRQLLEISIILCDTVDIDYENKIGSLKDYEFVVKNHEFYLKVPAQPFMELKNNDRFQDALSDIFITKYSFLDKDATARAIGRDINSRIDRAKANFGNNTWIEAEAKLGFLSSNNDTDYSSVNAEILYNLRDKYFQQYEQKLYSKFKNYTVEEQKMFVNELILYKDHEFDLDSIPKSKNANMLEFLLGTYPLLNENIVTITDMYRTRNESYRQLCLEFEDSLDILKQLLDNNYFESWLRFGELTTIRNEMHTILSKINTPNKSLKHYQSHKSTNNTNPKEKLSVHHQKPSIKRNTSNTISLQTTNHYNYRKIINYTDNAQFINFDDVQPHTQINSRHINSNSKRSSLSSRKAQENRARIAEQLAIQELKNLGYNNILWVSAYAKEAGINPNGADGYGYDIQGEMDGQVRYIEVKSSLSSTGIEFEMSNNELMFCNHHTNNYDIVYVYDMNRRSPKITLIKNAFYKINSSPKLPTSYKIKLK